MLPVQNVELTKVHYFEPTKHHRNIAIPTISQEVFENTFNRNVIIKKNIFGHRWVLKINEIENGTLKKKRNVKFWVYSAVFVCILVAVLGGLFLTFNLENILFYSTNVNLDKKNESEPENFKNIFGVNNSINQIRANGHMELSVEEKFNHKLENSSQKFRQISKKYSSSSNESPKIYCVNCTETQVCMKTEETEIPKCLNIVDDHDPTGCGGICLLNVEYCAILDRKHKVFQCTPLRNLLKCPTDAFNCGEQCISMKKVCDGITHCIGQQDEQNCDCNLKENFLCTNSTHCLPKNKQCDGFIDCWDRSDESQCTKGIYHLISSPTGCPPKMYSCLNGQCISEAHFCDGTAQCSDFSDEPQGCQI